MSESIHQQPKFQETSAQPLDVVSFFATAATVILPIIVLYRLFHYLTRSKNVPKPLKKG
jgi:hypothetical protein